MNTKFRYMAAAAAILAAFSCAKQEEPASPEEHIPSGTYQYILNVSQEDTKVTMGDDGLSILWSADDKIGITCNDPDNKYRSAAESGGEQSITDESYQPSTKAAFSCTITEDYTPVAAGYPYADGMRHTSGSGDNALRMNVNIPAVQTGKVKNLPDGALAMVGKIQEDNSCQMSNVGAVIRFEITNDNIASVRFEGNNGEVISGERLYYIASGKFAYEKTDSEGVVQGSTSVTLVPEGTEFEKGTYHFVVSPNTLTEGFTMTITTTDGRHAVRKTSSEFKIERNHKYTNFGSDDWFTDITTAPAGNLGTETGKTANLYGIIASDIEDGDSYGFETSDDGEKWTEYAGEIKVRTTNSLNVLTASMEDLTAGVTKYYRAYYTTSGGATTYAGTRAITTHAGAQSVILDFYNGKSSDYWPINNLAHNNDIKIGSSGNATYKGSECQMTTKTGGHTFTAKATNGIWLGNGNGCLTLGVQTGDYIKLPEVDGQKPVSVTIVAGNLKDSKDKSAATNKLGYPSVANVDGTSFTAITGGGAWDPRPAYIYKSHTWDIITEAGKEYAICFNESMNCYISYIEVVYISEDIDTRSEVIEQDLVFWAGTGDHKSTSNPDKDIALSWPFSQKQSTGIGPFSTAAYPDIQYSYITTNNLTTTRQGLIFGGAEGDYMQFHGVEDYKLTMIKIRGGNKATAYSVTDSDGNVTQGGEQQTIGTAYDSTVEFKLTKTLADTEYRLALGSPTQTAIREMWITYELVQ